jgi:hypothetical protein
MCEASIDPDDKLSCILDVGNDGVDSQKAKDVA